MRNDNRIEFRSTPLKAQLRKRSRGSLGAVAERDLTRYYQLLQQELKRIKLTKEEALFFCDLLNGLLLADFQINPSNLLLVQAQDGIHLNRLNQKWGLDANSLLEKIVSLTPLQAVSIIDAVEQFWILSASEPPDSTLSTVFPSISALP